MALGYDEDDPRREQFQRNLALGIYKCKQPETQRQRVAALARKIRNRK